MFPYCSMMLSNANLSAGALCERARRRPAAREDVMAFVTFRRRHRQWENRPAGPICAGDG